MTFKLCSCLLFTDTRKPAWGVVQSPDIVLKHKSVVSCQGEVSPSMYLRVRKGTLVCMCVCARACFVEEKEVTGWSYI